LAGKVEPELTGSGKSDLVLNINDDWIRIDSELIVLYKQGFIQAGFLQTRIFLKAGFFLKRVKIISRAT